jgi:hypothetical protein
MLSATSAGTAANPVQIGDIPAIVAPLQAGSSRNCGIAIIVDANTAIHYAANVIPLSSSTLRFIVSGSTNYFGLDPAITIASGDTVALTCAYEAAS